MLLVYLGIAVLIVLFLILKLKVNAAISLVIGSLFMGIVAGLGMIETVGTITKGFGNLMSGIGLSIGFGIILGQLLSDFGGAQKIANTLVDAATEKFALYALAFTALILSIPVFFDVVFVILVPLGISVAKRINKPVPYAIAAMAVGAMVGHTFIPPTPNPMAAAEIFNFDLGTMVIVGIIGGVLATLFGSFVLFTALDKGFWNKEKDELPEASIVGGGAGEESKVAKKDISGLAGNMAVALEEPSFALSITPILLPVVLILLTTVVGAVTGSVPKLLGFMGNKTIALLIGVIICYMIAKKTKMSSMDVEKSVAKGLEAAGIVLLITGAGGSFGAVISATGISDFIASNISTLAGAPVMAIVLSASLGFVFRIALGSGTVASITAMTIMSGVAPAVAIHPVFIALACLSGSISIGHVNDSGFWVVTNMGGFSVTGGMKIYTFGGFLIGVVGIVISLIGALVM